MVDTDSIPSEVVATMPICASSAGMKDPICAMIESSATCLM